MGNKQGGLESMSGVGVLLSSAAFRWQKAAAEALVGLGLSSTQFVLLVGIHTLSESDELVTQVLLSRHVGIDAMLTSKHVRLLEEHGAIVREAHPTDSRANVLSLTREGLTTLKHAMKIVDRVDRELFGADASGKVLKQLLRMSGWIL